jgi:hypothetical protein
MLKGKKSKCSDLRTVRIKAIPIHLRIHFRITKKIVTRNASIFFKGDFPPKIDIQTWISGVQLKTQNFTLNSNLPNVFYLVAYF